MLACLRCFQAGKRCRQKWLQLSALVSVHYGLLGQSSVVLNTFK